MINTVGRNDIREELFLSGRFIYASKVDGSNSFQKLMDSSYRIYIPAILIHERKNKGRKAFVSEARGRY